MSKLSSLDRLAIDLYVAAYRADPNDVERWWIGPGRSRFRHINETTRAIWRRVARRARKATP